MLRVDTGGPYANGRASILRLGFRRSCMLSGGILFLPLYHLLSLGPEPLNVPPKPY